MYWADYRDGAKKAKVHIGFDLNRGIPKKIFLTDGLIFLFDKTLLSLEVSNVRLETCIFKGINHQWYQQHMGQKYLAKLNKKT